MGERRGSRRQKSLLRGFIYVSRRRIAVACVVRDLSAKGARITFAEPVTLPDALDLYIPQRRQTLHARVQWRRNHEIGLAFVDAERAPAAESTAAEVEHRVATLEAEITTLRELLKHLKGDKASEADAA